MKNPCYGCEQRTADCHGTCEAYHDWKAEHDKKREAERKSAIDDYRVKEYKSHIKARIKKARE